MIEAPTSRISSGSSALIVAFVPTGMNCGVSTTPWVNSRRPTRARVAPLAGGGTSTVKRAAAVTRPVTCRMDRPARADRADSSRSGGPIGRRARALVGGAVAVHRGVVAGPFEQAVDDPRRPAPTPGDRPGCRMVDRDREDRGRPIDDRAKVFFLVEVEPIGGPKAVTERARDPAGAR